MKSCQSGGSPYIVFIDNQQKQIMKNKMFSLMCMLGVQKKERITPPFAKAIAMIAAISITHDKGFHINPRNLRNLLSCFSIFNQREKDIY